MKTDTRRGFTIVELLIVIVVIGVLATIAIVAYNGIQVRARNSQTASVMQAYKKAFIQYAVVHQVYPISTAACLGDDYPDVGVFTVANTRNCFRSNTTTGSMSTTFNNEIKPYLGNKVPTPNNTIFGGGVTPAWSTRGAVFMNTSAVFLNGVANPWIIVYTIEGQNQCPVGPVLDLSAYPNTTTSPASGYSLLLSGGTVGVECWVALPDPTKL